MKCPCPIRFKALLLACCFAVFTAAAHEPSKSYLGLTLDSGRIIGHWDIPLRDFRNVVPLDQNKKSDYSTATAYAAAHLQILLDGQARAPELNVSKPAVEELSDGEYLRLNFLLEHFPPPRIIELEYHLFFETNSLHRGLTRLAANGRVQIAAFSPGHESRQFQLAAPAADHPFRVFLREGVWHIWTGYDHILFLLALLLPAVLQREAGHWRGVGAWQPAFWNVLKIVTAFTLAHSLTLSLAALGVIKLPSRLTESAIALSVVLAAANNLWPLVRERGWLVAFAFGLVHGFGFATALSDFGLTRGNLITPLVGFNLGVEIGQLAVVATFLPTAFALRRTWFYQSPLLGFGSAAIILVAGTWFTERALDLKFIPF